MNACPAENTLTGLVQGRLADDQVASVEAHVESCPSCFRLVAGVARTTCDSGDASVPHGAVVTSGLGLLGDVPRRIEEYYILRPIGHGGMGQVFLAVDMRLDRPVAIKLLAVETRDAARERFLVEARAVARLSHPNVVTIHRVGEIQQRTYLVYEFVRGKSLDLVDKPLPWRRAREVALGLARGLQAAHRAGVLHRDIKPANSILCENGSVKLLDFGLAKLGDSESDHAAEVARSVLGEPELAPRPTSVSLTRTGALMGTPLYMAPEAWLGDAPTVRMDLYSLGAVVYELCTGRPLHAGRTIEDIQKAAFSAATPLADVVPGIDPEFARAVDGCLARDPAARHASADALVASLERVAARPPRRRGRVVVAAALVLAALAATAFVALRRTPRAHARSAAAALSSATGARVCSGDHWCWDPGKPKELGNVWARTRDDAWAVGRRGTIRHWDGLAWREVDSRTVANLGAVRGIAANDVWAVGAWGTALHWDGVRWQKVATGTRAALFDVLALTRDDVWAVGSEGTTLHWDGKGWNSVPSGVVGNLSRLAATGPDDVWAAGSKVVHWDGERWSLSDAGNTHTPLYGITILANHEVWVAGYDGFVRRLVKGRWLDVELPLSESERKDFWINAIWASGSDDIWLMSKREPLLHWDGHSWTRSGPANSYEYYGLAGTGPNDLWAVSATDLISHYDGRTWTSPADVAMVTEYQSVWAASREDVWAVGYRGNDLQPTRLYGTIDRFDGQAWRRLDVGARPGLFAVWGSRDDDVWVAGDQGTILHWDGSQIRPVGVGVSADVRALSGTGSDDVWAVGKKGAVRHWDGSAWSASPSGVEVDLRGVWASAGEAWAVGDKGTTLHWDGATWQSVPSNTDKNLRGVWGSSPKDVWAVGTSGTVIHWDGRSWSAVFSETRQHLQGISGSGPDDVWAVTYMFDDLGTIVHWDGTGWTAQRQTPDVILRGVYSLGPGDVWAVGIESMIMRYQPLGAASGHE